MEPSRLILSSAMTLAWTGCGSSSTAPAAGDAPPVLSGEYLADTGERESITFSDAGHYSFVWRSCDAGAGRCIEDGTFSLNDRRDTLTFTNAVTGASISLPFQVDSLDPADAIRTQSRPLADPAPLTGGTSGSTLTGGTSGSTLTVGSSQSRLLNINGTPIIVQFSTGNTFKLKQNSTILGVRG